MAALGPGLLVMLADTDAGSIVTAAQSGAQWGYSLLLPQLVLIPVLYGVQEITVRLGVISGEGHAALIRRRFGWGWALLSVTTLFVACVGALITEFAGIAGAGELFGLPRWLTVGAAVVLLVALVVTEGYNRVERVGLAVGLLELLFIPAAILAHPEPSQMATGMATLPLTNRDFLILLAANVGAVIMPWMIFYQQGAVIDKGLHRPHLRIGRWDTLLGAVVTQIIMGAVVVAVAATIGQQAPGTSLQSIGEIAAGLAPAVGQTAANWLFGLGIAGASLVAALVVSLSAAWGVSEAFDWHHSLNDPLPRARRFYGLYALALIGSAGLVLARGNLVDVSVGVEVLNATLLPIVLGLLLVLEATVLPARERMRGIWRVAVWAAAGMVMLLGVYVAAITLAGLLGGAAG